MADTIDMNNLYSHVKKRWGEAREGRRTLLVWITHTVTWKKGDGGEREKDGGHYYKEWLVQWREEGEGKRERRSPSTHQTYIWEVSPHSTKLILKYNYELDTVAYHALLLPRADSDSWGCCLSLPQTKDVAHQKWTCCSPSDRKIILLPKADRPLTLRLLRYRRGISSNNGPRTFLNTQRHWTPARLDRYKFNVCLSISAAIHLALRRWNLWSLVNHWSLDVSRMWSPCQGISYWQSSLGDM